MQAITRRAPAYVASTTRLAARRSPGLNAVSKRTYAEDPNVKRGSGGEPSGNTSNLPLIAAVGVVLFIPLYYFAQGTKGTGQKAPGQGGQAEIKEKRREQGTENEYRDPRDSAVKTTSQDKAWRENSK